jgi:hypothetical protein
MDKLDVMADISLQELAKRERLQAIIRQPAYQYYFQGGIIGVLAGLCGVAFLIWLLLKHAIPAWGFMVIGLAFIALLESMRTKDRLDAMVKTARIRERRKSEQGVAGYRRPDVGHKTIK